VSASAKTEQFANNFKVIHKQPFGTYLTIGKIYVWLILARELKKSQNPNL
jgi:hypothetical protein